MSRQAQPSSHFTYKRSVPPMSTLFPHAEIGKVVATGALGLCILLMACGPVRAQPNDRRPAPSAQVSAPSTQDQRGVRAPGTDLPSAAEPARPPSSFDQPPASSNPPGGTAQSNNAPGTPQKPSQTPPPRQATRRRRGVPDSARHRRLASPVRYSSAPYRPADLSRLTAGRTRRAGERARLRREGRCRGLGHRAGPVWMERTPELRARGADH